MKKSVLILLAVLAVLTGLTACNDGNGPLEQGPETPEDARYIKEAIVVLDDGREVTCLYISGYRKGGLSCDWPSASATEVEE